MKKSKKQHETPITKKVSTLRTILYIKVSKMTTILLKNSCEKQSSNHFLFRFRFFYETTCQKDEMC